MEYFVVHFTLLDELYLDEREENDVLDELCEVDEVLIDERNIIEFTPEESVLADNFDDSLVAFVKLLDDEEMSENIDGLNNDLKDKLDDCIQNATDNLRING